MATNAHLDHYYQEELPALLKASPSPDTPASPASALWESLSLLPTTVRLGGARDPTCFEWVEVTSFGSGLGSASSWLHDIVQDT